MSLFLSLVRDILFCDHQVIVGATWVLRVQVVRADFTWVASGSSEGCVHADDIAVFAGLDSFGTVSLS